MDFMDVSDMTDAELLEEFKWLEYVAEEVRNYPEYVARYAELDAEMTRRCG